MKINQSDLNQVLSQIQDDSKAYENIEFEDELINETN